MYCTKCGAKVNEGVNFCPSCGTPLNNNKQNQFEYDNNTHQNQFEYGQTYNQIGSDEDFLRAYVGNNYEKIKNNSFSIPTFFLGAYYFLYRKLYLYGIILAAINLACSIIGGYTSLASFIIQIILCLNFSKIYLQFAQKKIEIIKQSNLDKSNQELLEICRKKGGTSAGIPIAFACIIFIVAFTYGVFIGINEIIDETNSTNENKNPGNSSNNSLNYTVPQGFTTYSEETNNYKSYYYSERDGSCSLRVYAVNYKYLYEDATEYLNDNVYTKPSDTTTEITDKAINGETWKYLNVTSDNKTVDAYAIMKDQNIYFIEFTDNKVSYTNGDVCPTKKEEFINSISFKKTRGGNSV